MEDRRYLSRKFWLAAAALLIGTGLVIAKIVTPEQWVGLTEFLVAAYMAGNVGDSFASKVAP